ncbi:hypothetical protein SLEP1_g12286 [Rubroshorea leprosula]|uniref:Reverse transcriptase n=1 Tax=Rubroshorea leprosula TaxID=152421 RepID=A0AAV5IHR2_9ROSI|nr:hypothetical protein SLEP1_g12286 [Rubroshorea leprosula]
MTLMVDGESFLIKVSEEECRMDPDWWLASERKSSDARLDVSDMECDNSDDRYNEGDDRAIMAEDCAEMEVESNLSLKHNFVQNFELNGLEMDGLGNVGSFGPRVCEAEELDVENGSCEGLRPVGVQQKGAALSTKKCKTLGDIYARDGVAKETRELGLQWVTARTRCRKERRETARQSEQGTESRKTDLPLLDGCIQNRNKLIRKQLELDEDEMKPILKGPETRVVWSFAETYGSSFIGVSGEWSKEKIKCNVINVYAPCDRQRKVLLWEEIAGQVLEEGGCWLLASDFNAIRNVSERKGKMRETQNMQDFNHFVESTGKECRLGSKAFSGNGCMAATPRFQKFVEDKWTALQVEGWAAYKCKQKLKLMKDECKRWNKEVFSNVETRWGILSKEIKALDIKSEEIELDENEVLLQKECFQERWEILRKREAMWKQKARNNWIRLGDANTAFFHRCVHARRAQNAISRILGEAGWVEEPTRVKEEAVRYFSQLFHNEQWNRPVLGGVHFNRISVAQKEWLEIPFSIEEIEEGL